MTRFKKRIVVAFTAALASSGCVEEFDPASRIDYSRPLGVRVEVAGDPERAWAMPGETIRASWLVAQPEEAAPLTWAFVVCPGAATGGGPEICAGPPIQLPCAETPSNAAPSFEVELPAAALEGSDRVAMFGLICVGGTLPFECSGEGLPSIPEGGGSLDAFECIGDGAERLLVTTSIPVQLGTTTNRNPAIAELTLAGQAWPEPTAEMLDGPVEGCPAEGELEVTRRTPEVEIALAVPPESVETYRSSDGDEELIERLLVSHYVTAGELDTQYSYFDSGATEITLPWTPPTGSTVVEQGLRVRFYFIVRDGRGGAVWRVRTVCVK